jgi:hypothetical protein
MLCSDRVWWRHISKNSKPPEGETKDSVRIRLHLQQLQTRLNALTGVMTDSLTASLPQSACRLDTMEFEPNFIFSEGSNRPSVWARQWATNKLFLLENLPVRKYIKNIRTRRRPGSSSSPQIERCFFAYMKQKKFRQYKQDELNNKYKKNAVPYLWITVDVCQELSHAFFSLHRSDSRVNR